MPWPVSAKWDETGTDISGPRRPVTDPAAMHGSGRSSEVTTVDRTAAVLTGLIATCTRHHMHPFVYLRHVFARTSAHPQSRLEEYCPTAGWPREWQ